MKAPELDAFAPDVAGPGVAKNEDAMDDGVEGSATVDPLLLALPGTIACSVLTLLEANLLLLDDTIVND